MLRSSQTEVVAFIVLIIYLFIFKVVAAGGPGFGGHSRKPEYGDQRGSGLGGMEEVLERSGDGRRSGFHRGGRTFWLRGALRHQRSALIPGVEEEKQVDYLHRSARERLQTASPPRKSRHRASMWQADFGIGSADLDKSTAGKKFDSLAGRRLSFKLSCWYKCARVHQSCIYLGHFGLDSSDSRSGAKVILTSHSSPFLSGYSRLQNLRLLLYVNNFNSFADCVFFRRACAAQLSPACRRVFVILISL